MACSSLQMIQRKPQNRLGNNGAHEVKNHPWLKDFPWDDLMNKRIKAPFIPPKEDNFDQKNINEEWADLHDDAFKENFVSLRRQSVQQLFQGYYYDYQLADIAKDPKVIESGLQELIMKNIHNFESQSQQQDPITMATSDSAATISGIYSQTNLIPIKSGIEGRAKNNMSHGPHS